MRLFKKPIVFNIKDKDWVEAKQSDTPYSSGFIGSCIILALGLGLITLGVLFLFGINPLNATGSGWGAVVPGCLFAGGGLYNLLLTHITRCLIPEWKLHEKLNADYVTLNKVMRKNDVQPRYIINGDRYYSPSDFAEISTLLRASIAPAATQEVLLRPADANVETHQEQLLRAANPTAEEAPAQNYLSLASQREKQPEEQINRLRQ